MAYDSIPIHGNPNGGVFGVIGERVSTDLGLCHIKSSDDTLNVGWNELGIPASPTPTQTPFLTPTPTPTITPSPSITPSVTPTITKTPTVTPTLSITPTNTPTHTQTPSITPTNTVTPTVTNTTGLTPTPTPTPVTYYNLYTTSSVASTGSTGGLPGNLAFILDPPGGTYSAGTTVWVTIVPNSNSSASFYFDGSLIGTFTNIASSSITMNSHHTASAVFGWRDVRWKTAVKPSGAGIAFGPGQLTSSLAKKGEVITIYATASNSTFVSWSYSNSAPVDVMDTLSDVTLANDGVHEFTASFVLNTSIIRAFYDVTTGTSSYLYRDSAGNTHTFFETGSLGGWASNQCGVLDTVIAGTAQQTTMSCS